jgi:hypothetical protein
MQEFFPQSRSSHKDESDELSESSIQRPTSWSNSSRTGDVTKNEHPSTFEEDAIPPYSYPAQDRRRPGGEQTQSKQQTTSTRSQQHFSPDGDALEHGYRPYQVPFWTRPQPQRRRFALRSLLLIILLILLIKLIPILAALVLTLLGIGLFLIILPMLIVVGFVLVFGGLVLFVLSRMGFPVWRNLFRRRRWSRW